MVEIVSHSEALGRRVIDLILEIQRTEFGFDIRAEDQLDLLDVVGFAQVAAESLPAAFPRMSLDTRFYCRALS